MEEDNNRITKYSQMQSQTQEAKSKAWICKICDKNFELRGDLKLHSRSHSKTYNCLKCNKTFSTSISLISHHQRAHRPISTLTKKQPSSLLSIKFITL